MYQDNFAPEVIALRCFRNEVLYSNWFGTLLAKLYYRTSPPLDGFISRHPFLRSLIKPFLDRLAGKWNKQQDALYPSRFRFRSKCLTRNRIIVNVNTPIDESSLRRRMSLRVKTGVFLAFVLWSIFLVQERRLFRALFLQRFVGK